MKDIVITKAMQKRELYILLACFVVANIVNWVTIVKFQTPWYEVFTQIGYITVTTLTFYGLVAVLRLAWWIFRGVLTKN